MHRRPLRERLAVEGSREEWSQVRLVSQQERTFQKMGDTRASLNPDGNVQERENILVISIWNQLFSLWETEEGVRYPLGHQTGNPRI